TDRVSLTSNYTTISGLAFNALLSDPDKSSVVTFSTSGGFTNYGMSDSHVFAGAKLEYVAQTSTTINNSGNSTLGLIRITDVNNPVTLSDEPFKLTITQTAPWPASFTINCKLSGTITSSSSFVVVT